MTASAILLSAALGAALPGPIPAAAPGPAATPAAEAPAPARALVHAKSAPIWAEPRSGSRKVETVFGGHAVDVLGTQGEWTHVRSGRHQGWVESSVLEPWTAR